MQSEMGLAKVLCTPVPLLVHLLDDSLKMPEDARMISFSEPVSPTHCLNSQLAQGGTAPIQSLDCQSSSNNNPGIGQIGTANQL